FFGHPCRLHDSFSQGEGSPLRAAEWHAICVPFYGRSSFLRASEQRATPNGLTPRAGSLRDVHALAETNEIDRKPASRPAHVQRLQSPGVASGARLAGV